VLENENFSKTIFSHVQVRHFPGDIQWLTKVFTPLGIFPILLPYNLDLKRICRGFVSFDLHNMPATLKMQNIFYCQTNKKSDKKTENLSVHNYSPPESQYFVESPFAALQLQVS
jgi:hypothetical protein